MGSVEAPFGRLRASGSMGDWEKLRRSDFEKILYHF
jgi:hypothetical protein